MTPKLLFAATLLLAPLCAQTPNAALPHLEKRGAATQLIVDGKPYLALAGELTNTGSSDLVSMQPVWTRLAHTLHLNTVLTGVAWSWIEPEEGRFDFRIVDDAIENARKHDIRLMWVWFGTWKNGLSSFAPAWVKADTRRFPRVHIRGGKAVEIITPLSTAARDADARALAALMRHVREVDKTHRVIMVQVENEVGVLGDVRDRSPEAESAFAKAVPQALTAYLQSHRQSLLPEFRKVWEDAGAKTAGTWEEVFGKGVKAEEIFMAWHYATFVSHVAAAGKAELAVPTFVNAWIVQPEDRGPGDYPSGGPQDHMHDVWRAGAPAIDLLCPDIYLPDFTTLAARYSRGGNPLFVPESVGDIRGAANAFYAIGQHAAIGYSPFAIDISNRLLGRGPDAAAAPVPADLSALPLPVAYQTLAQLAPLILEHQSKGTIAAVIVNKQKPDTQIRLGDYTLNIGLQRSRRALDVVPDVTGYGIFMATGPNEYILAGDNLQVTFTPATPGPAIAGLAGQEAGEFVAGQWRITRQLAGDDSVLRYDMAAVAAMNQSGSGVRLNAGQRGLQRVRLYRYE